MGFSTSSLQVELVTPEKAGQFLSYNYANNRRVRQPWVDYLVREMQAGRFMSTAEIHVMYRNGEPVMVNGQHTCRAIMKYGKPIRVTVRKSTTNETGQIAMAYAFGHDSGIRRSFTDGMNAYNLSEQTGLSAWVIDSLVGAVKFVMHGFNGKRTGGAFVKESPADMVKYVLAFAPAMKMFDVHVMPCEKQLLKRLRQRRVLSVALLTFYYQPEKASDFWRQVANPDRLVLDDARVTARRYIENSVSRPQDEEAKTPRRIARCWRAFYEGNSIERVQGINPMSAIVIAGTPYNGKQRLDYAPDVDAAYELDIAA
jgi:hypothetical protein